MTKEQWKMAKIYHLFHPIIWYVNPAYRHVESFVKSIQTRFRQNEGEIIHHGRNELRKMEFGGQMYVVKSFCRPIFLNRLIYGVYRASKAKRSYQYALKFLKMGVGTPQPVGYLERRSGLLFDESYYVSCLSTCPYVYTDLTVQKQDCTEKVCREIGRVTALMHEKGFAHKDYSRGNILYGFNPDGSVKIEIVDLNRMYMGRVGFKRGCQNFERLPATLQMSRWMAEEYAKVRGFDPDKCCQLMHEARIKYSQRNHDTNPIDWNSEQ